MVLRYREGYCGRALNEGQKERQVVPGGGISSAAHVEVGCGF